ncbi:ROK family transcriptional regulator [Alkalihalobacillus alcalophilus ATCC 27647 = CGMCC 1.3604]|uniref:ROK family transcriptional regulator n=1 Tax=Alkalihalobacillus alcalophilus ATCC 27647 = CGMCC 1.3604 TaxID=1218173 RepID=A0A4S4JYE8_ALKAL|nr:ROK family transcriptional regulator [Alkalihalobacillus alcalophilus]MED1564190.1 ROK family transcriptional regulator [Alkalihalobacillus alcalophilus]THG90254.1 ROK family transcriptional regulator [Alkalihalobacillus alcalophilus ATCC 27647 = CGMCC 1.3604]
MSRIQTGSFQGMKLLNKSTILNTIRLHSPISRAEIAKKTKLTPATVTNIVTELINENLVCESKVGTSQGGRKPILLTINNRDSFIVGVDVGGHTVRAVVTNLSATIQARDEITLPSPLTKDELLKQIVLVIQAVMTKSKINKDKIIGIGIGMHGVVDHLEGIAIFAPNFQLRQIPIKKHLEAQFQIPVYVENDVRAFTLGETWFGNGKGIDNLICINIGVGIGAGIILNDQLFHGQNGIAGEIGHVIVDINGRKCSCGSYGCLQTIAGGEVLRERALESEQNQELLKKAHNDPNAINGALIYQCAKEGDPLSLQLLADTGRYIGVGVINLIHLINPTRIIIGGGVAKAGDYVLAPLREVVKERALTAQARETEILQSKLGDDGTMIGAATLVLKHLFNPHITL